MKYKIGDVAKIVGMPVETVRFYESKRIINPEKDLDSNYRYYRAWDINYLLECKRWRSLDFSMENVSHILNHYSYSDLQNELLLKEEALKKQIIWYQKLLSKVVEYNTKLLYVQDFVGKCRLEESPEIYFYTHRHNYNYETSPEYKQLTVEWLKWLPFTNFHVELPKDALLNPAEHDEYKWGFSLNSDDVTEFGVNVEAPVRQRTTRPSVYTVITAHEEGSFSSKLLDHAVQFIQENQLTITGEAIGNLVVRVHEGDQYIRYFEIWIPIE